MKQTCRRRRYSAAFRKVRKHLFLADQWTLANAVLCKKCSLCQVLYCEGCLYFIDLTKVTNRLCLHVTQQTSFYACAIYSYVNSEFALLAGYVCLRAFDMTTRQPKLLAPRLHQSGAKIVKAPASRKGRGKGRPRKTARTKDKSKPITNQTSTREAQLIWTTEDL